MREFATGATRNDDDEKYDYEGFFSPLVLERRAEYMHKHRLQADGKLRDSDNWQKGMPLTAYMKSGFRHFHDWWKLHRSALGVVNGKLDYEALEEAICALMFNAEGYLHVILERQCAKENRSPGPEFRGH